MATHKGIYLFPKVCACTWLSRNDEPHGTFKKYCHSQHMGYVISLGKGKDTNLKQFSISKSNSQDMVKIEMWSVTFNLYPGVIQLNNEGICTLLKITQHLYIPDNSKISQDFTMFVRKERAISNQIKECGCILGIVNYKEN